MERRDNVVGPVVSLSHLWKGTNNAYDKGSLSSGEITRWKLPWGTLMLPACSQKIKRWAGLWEKRVRSYMSHCLLGSKSPPSRESRDV